MRYFAAYTLPRLGIFLALWFGLSYPLGTYLGGITAAVLSFFVSVFLLRGQRDKVVARWMAADEKRRANRVEKRDEDADTEDILLYGLEEKGLAEKPLEGGSGAEGGKQGQGEK
ncbi:DUF4229 domain-containing protein [Dermabacteraceae bacterium TAE3-ERU27]|nr:DUF4229 domain-containing protein [Dermabacteraceae bacterium TAE3-ERU27]